MDVFLLSLAGYLLGSIPFSVWLGQSLFKTSILRYGEDRNPGSAIARRAGTQRVALPVLLLGFIKETLPVGPAVSYFHLFALQPIPIALALFYGHAFSPVPRFQGGRAIAVTVGVRTALLLADGPIVLGLYSAVLILILSPRTWVLMFGMAELMVYLLVAGAGIPILAIWLGNFILSLWKRLPEIRHGKAINPRLLKRSKSQQWTIYSSTTSWVKLVS
jgi:glycerol-3-phosphate acyltransferase PlsY